MQCVGHGLAWSRGGSQEMAGGRPDLGTGDELVSSERAAFYSAPFLSRGASHGGRRGLVATAHANLPQPVETFSIKD